MNATEAAGDSFDATNGTTDEARNASEPSADVPATEESCATRSASYELVERLLKAHEAYYDIEREYAFGGRRFAGFAALHADSSQYVLIKRAKLWEAHTHEYLFFHPVEVLDRATLDELVAFMEGSALGLVEPEPNHMTSYLSLVFIAERADEDALRALRKTRFRKNLKLGLEGWVDLRLAAIDLASGRVVTNGQGKALKPTLEANLNPANA